MLNNFIITGYGRSGTKFLVTQLNKSVQWAVEHEASPHFILVAERFNREYYGEVNSNLLYQLLTIPVEHKVIIVRDPYAIMQSTYNRGHPLSIQRDVHAAVAILLMYYELGIRFFRFNELVQSRERIIELANTVGIMDLRAEDLDLQRVNESETTEWLDFEEVVQEHIREEFDYFNNVFKIEREVKDD